MVTYSKKFCWSSMIIRHYYNHLFLLNVFIFEASHEECDMTQFSQLNLNSSFLQLVRSACFYVTIRGNFKRFQLKQIFWKMKTFFKKLEYCFLVESAKIENAFFPYKTAISEANVKRNRMVSTKWTQYKERSFAINYFIFLFPFMNLL